LFSELFHSACHWLFNPAQPEAGLTPAGILPANRRGFTGVSFEMRGEAAARVLLPSYHLELDNLRFY